MPGERLNLLEKSQIVDKLAAGQSLAQTARDVGRSVDAVKDVRKERRHQIEKETARYIETLPSAVDQKIKLLKEYDSIDSVNDTARYKAAVSAADDMLKAVGILPTNTGSVAIQNLYVDQRSVTLSPIVSDAMRRLLPAKTDPDDDDPLDVVVD